MGWPHPDYLLKALSPRQFAEWAEFYNTEPWGFDVDDARLGVLCASIFRSQGSKTAKPEDFMMGEPPEVEETHFASILGSALGAVEAK